MWSDNYNLASPGLIINADDLGIHPAINEGILSAYKHGVLTSATMLVTTPYLEQTVLECVRPTGLPVGLHLSLTLGKAISPPSQVPDLVNVNGEFKLNASEFFSLRGGNSSLTYRLLPQIRLELDAQLSLASDYGINATHADSHQHVHMAPAIFQLVEELLPNYGIRRLRLCRESITFKIARNSLIQAVKRNNLAKLAALWLCDKQNKPRLATTDRFFGVFQSGAMTKSAFIAILDSIGRHESVEIGLHPGFPAKSFDFADNLRPAFKTFIGSMARQIEHDLLVAGDVHELITSRGYALRDFDGRRKC